MSLTNELVPTVSVMAIICIGKFGVLVENEQQENPL